MRKFQSKTPEEKKEQLEALSALLENGVKGVYSSEPYKQYLKVMSKRYHYSARNMLLIWLQKPDFQFVASFDDFKKKYGHSVKKGEKAYIEIYAPSVFDMKPDAALAAIKSCTNKGEPFIRGSLNVSLLDGFYCVSSKNGNANYIEKSGMNESELLAYLKSDVCGKWMLGFRSTYVFDLSQTAPIMLKDANGNEYMDPKAEAFQTALKQEFITDIKDGDIGYAKRLYDALAENINIPINFKKMPSCEDGSFSSSKMCINLNDSKPITQTLATLIHEEAHHRLHNRNNKVDTGEIEGVDVAATAKLDKEFREIQAESIAFVVLNYFGIDASCFTFGYVAQWSKDIEAKKLIASFDVIQKTAMQLISEMEKSLEKNNEQTAGLADVS